MPHSVEYTSALMINNFSSKPKHAMCFFLDDRTNTRHLLERRREKAVIHREWSGLDQDRLGDLEAL